MKFEASTFIEDEAGTLILKLNGREVISGSGKIAMELDPNESYELVWEVKGMKGTAYTISVSHPVSAAFHLSKVLQHEKETSFIKFY